jgi:probable HAF family extracellular repeat protein
MHDLGLLPGMSYSIAYAINAAGQVVGYSTNATTSENEAFIWQPDTPNGSTGTMVELDDLPGAHIPVPFAINSHGVVVGTLSILTPSTYVSIGAFIWFPDAPNATTGRMLDLNDLIDDADATDWTLLSASGINDQGQIVGYGSFDPDGPGGSPAIDRGFLLTPTVPEPATAALMALGALMHLIIRPKRFICTDGNSTGGRI